MDHSICGVCRADGEAMTYPTFTDAAKASGKRLDDSQRRSCAEADQNPSCCALWLMLRKGRIEMDRTAAGVTVRVVS